MTAPLKVCLVGNFAGDRQESMLRFGSLLATGLTAAGHTVDAVAPRPRLARLGGTYRYGGWRKYLGYVDKFVLFPRELRRRWRRAPPDVVHVVDHANAAYAVVARDAGLCSVVTCHDLLQIRAARGEFPRHAVGRSGRAFQRWILGHLRRAPAIACVSAKTAADLERLRRADGPARAVLIRVVPNGLNYPYRALGAAAARAHLARQPDLAGRLGGSLDGGGGYLLNIGGGQWYKNRPGLLRIYAALRPLLEQPPSLALVGKPLSPEDARLAAALGIDRWLRPLGSVTEPELEALYGAAEGLLFPSWEEGFGWPIAEAQSCGCPVFTSDRPPMTEVGGSAAVYLDPADPAGAALRLASAWSERQRLRAEGLTRAARWAPDAMIAAYVDFYRSAP